MYKYVNKIGLILCLSIIVSGFTGCKNLKTSETVSEANVPTLTWYVPGDKQTDIEAVLAEVNKIIVPKIGAKLDVQYLEMAYFESRLTMAIASAKEFDLCFTSNWMNKFLPSVNKGAYLELNELIDNNAPKLKAALPSSIWNASTVNGKIYAVPNLQVLFSQNAVVVMKKYVDKYNLDVSKIHKIEDLEPFFEKIKQNEKDVFALSGGISGTKDDPFISPFYEEIQPSTGVGIRKDDSDKKLVILRETNEYKNALKTVRSWYQKGYIRPDAATASGADRYSGKYAVLTGCPWKPGVEAEESLKFKQDVVVIPMEQPYLEANAGVATMTAVSGTSKNPQKAIQLLELMNTDKELYNLLSFGIENKHYKKINDQQIEGMKDTGYSPNASWMFGNQFNAYYLQNQTPGTWEITAKMNDEAMKSPISGFILNTDPLKNELARLSAVMGEFKIINTGSIEIDEFYNKFISKLNESGQQTILQEAQKQVNEWSRDK